MKYSQTMPKLPMVFVDGSPGVTKVDQAVSRYSWIRASKKIEACEKRYMSVTLV